MRGKAAALLASLLLLACGGAPEAPTTRDDLGRDVALPREVRRVVTLSPNLTEMVYAIDAGERLVGADDFSNFPAAAGELPKVGGMQPNLEKIVALRPDLVLASTEGNHPNLAPALASARRTRHLHRRPHHTGRRRERGAGERVAAVLAGVAHRRASRSPALPARRGHAAAGRRAARVCCATSSTAPAARCSSPRTT